MNSLNTVDTNQILEECKKNNMNNFGLLIATLSGNIDMCTYFQDDQPIDTVENNTIKIQLLCNWTTTYEITQLWKKMLPKDISIEFSNQPDYWIIINAPPPGAYFVPKQTIVFQMEPHMDQHPEQWGEWANPNPTQFLKVFSHTTDYNNLEWHLSLDHDTLMNGGVIEKYNQLSTVLSDKYNDPGHIKRVDFVKFIENDIDIHVYGSNKFNYKNYHGSLPYHHKDAALLKYKYHFNAENHSIPNYFTEKIVDAIMAECLCFYWGCPNISSYINPLAYIVLDLNDIPGSMEIVRQAIENDEWEKRIDVIRTEKKRILVDMNFFTRILRSV